MSKQVSTPYLELRKTAVTFFTWQSEKHNVRQALPNVFDAWILQFFEEIINVDRTVWDKYQRWHIINDCLRAGIVELIDMQDGTFNLRSLLESEDLSSAAEIKSSAIEQTEPKSSGVVPELQTSGLK